MKTEAVLQVAFGLVGGLGIFLLGMKNLSEGMQAVAGNSLRRLIGAVTNNRLMAAGVGTLITCLIQSSSITTVMVVGFVNSGLMTLSQAIGVIMGANIGTTITGWILVLKVGKYGLPILGVAAFVYLFTKKDRLRYIAMAVMGVGMIFFGLELMKGACAAIKDLPNFEQWLARFSADDYLGVLKCMLTGCVLTLLVQSSSATLGITIALALTGAVKFETAAALVLGENIGTTVTALLASLGTTTNARRAAYFHVLFNMLGVAWISLVFFWYKDFVPWLISADVTKAVIVNGTETFPETTAAIAAVHSLFNITNALLFLPVTHKFARLLERFVPERAPREKPRLTNLDVRILETPVIAIEQSRVEILRMGDSCTRMMDRLRDVADEDQPDDRKVREVFEREATLDAIQDEVVAFMTDLLSASVPHSVLDEGRCQLRMADEYESISDYVTSILKFQLKLRDQGLSFDGKHRGEVKELHNMVAHYLSMVSESYQLRNVGVLPEAEAAGAEITLRVKELRDQHLDRVSEEKIDPYVNVAYTSTLNSYRRVRDHVLNIAEAVAGKK